MFSTFEQLKKRTPKEGINRKEYISLLIDEYYESNNIETQQQVTANLANFAYDPINWSFLKQAKCHELFIEILENSLDPALLVHAAAGVCNFCLDSQIADYIINSIGLKFICKLINRHLHNSELIGHLLATLVFLNNAPFEENFKSLLRTIQRDSCNKISNLITVLLDDFEQSHAAADQTIS